MIFFSWRGEGGTGARRDWVVWSIGLLLSDLVYYQLCDRGCASLLVLFFFYRGYIF